MFERLGDAGVRTACTPFLIYRGRTRHELGLEGLLRRVAARRQLPPRRLGPGRALLRRALRQPHGPAASRPSPARDPRRVLGLRAARELVERRRSTTSCSSRCPTTTTTRTARPRGAARVDRPAPTRPSRELVDAAGGLDAFLDDARGDPGRRPRPDRGRARAAARRRRSAERLGGAAAERRPPRARPSSRSARPRAPRRSTCSTTGAPRPAPTSASASACASSTASTWSPGSSTTASRSSARGRRPDAGRVEAVVERDGARAALPPRRAGPRPPRRGWDAERRPGGARGARSRDGRFDSRRVPRRARAGSGRR